MRRRSSASPPRRSERSTCSGCAVRGPNQGGTFQTNDAGSNNRDLKFFDVALADLRQRFQIDDARIYATGFSNGAKFVYLLWAARAKTLAAIAPVAGMLAPSLRLTEPKPVIHIGGREDQQNEFQNRFIVIPFSAKLAESRARG